MEDEQRKKDEKHMRTHQLGQNAFVDSVTLKERTDKRDAASVYQAELLQQVPNLMLLLKHSKLG